MSGIRPLIFGNGRILICEDEKGTIRDVYFPYVGLENHGNSIKVGICDLDSLYCSWLENWKIRQRYKSEFEDRFCDRILEILEDRKDKEEVREETGNNEALEACMEVVSNIGETVFENSEIGLRITVWEAVHPSVNIFYRTFEVRNISIILNICAFFPTRTTIFLRLKSEKPQ